MTRLELMPPDSTPVASPVSGGTLAGAKRAFHIAEEAHVGMLASENEALLEGLRKLVADRQHLALAGVA